jgi:hypothetical protein
MARKYQVRKFKGVNYSIKFPDELRLAIKRMDDPELRTKVLRSAAYAGARVLYDEMRRTVPVKTGELYGSIYHFHDEKQSNERRQVYLIGPNKVKAPHWWFAEHGHWLYNRYAAGKWLESKKNKSARVGKPEPSGWGDVHVLPGARDEPVFVPGTGFIWRTWMNKKDEALQAVARRARERFAELMKGGK